MRAALLLLVLVVGFAAAAGVREYRNGEYKAIITMEPKPDYPIQARRSKLQGSGQFRVYFGRDGRVTGIKVLKSTGQQVLDDAAMSAFRRWHAKPGPRRELDLPISYILSRTPYRPPQQKQPATILREFTN